MTDLSSGRSRRAVGTTSTAGSVPPCDAVVVLARRSGDAVELLPRPSGADGAALRSALAAVGFGGRPGEVARVPLDGGSATVVGVPPDATDAVLIGAVATGVRASTGATRVVVDVAVEDRRALYRGALLATHRFDAHKGAEWAEVAEVVLLGPDLEDRDRQDDLVAAICLARDLTTTPPADKTPQRLAELVAGLAAAAGAGCEVHDEAAISALGLTGLLAVAKGSAHPPVLLRLEAPGTGADRVAVVGKGLTYDAGGVNLKLTMLEMMKLDVGGAAAAIGAVLHAARHPRRRGLVVWVGLCENVISGTAYHGGDVLRMRNGVTVEVVNTDAEGRLTMADLLDLAAEDEPAELLTVATLTGSAMQALGMRTAALMTADDDLAEAVLTAAHAGGEDVWRMPVRAHQAASLRSPIADVTNLGDLKGQSMVAAAFLRRFAPDDIPYAHLDIAGPAYNPGDPYEHIPHGGTGFGVATLVHLLDR